LSDAVYDGLHGGISFHSTWNLDALALSRQAEVQRLEDRNDERRAIGNEISLKLYRTIESGPRPEIEMSRYLHDANFPNTPPLLGWFDYRAHDGTTSALGIAHRYVENQGSGWSVTLRYLDRLLERRLSLSDSEVENQSTAPDDVGLYQRAARTLGEALAALHRTLARPSDDPAFAPEPFSSDDLRALVRRLHEWADATLDALDAAAGTIASAAVQEQARSFAGRRTALHELVARLGRTQGLGRKTRIHGRFHLGNVLVTPREFLIVGFDGDPRTSLAERRAKSSPLDDVALLLQSFDYAVTATLLGLTVDRTEDLRRFEPELEGWRRRAADAFLEAYGQNGDEPLSGDLLGLFAVDKALRSLRYELTNRPSWVAIPLRSLERIISDTQVPSA
jgi:maltose alpha-D-glucosyltransferase / alpha-amylase